MQCHMVNTELYSMLYTNSIPSMIVQVGNDVGGNVGNDRHSYHFHESC